MIKHAMLLVQNQTTVQLVTIQYSTVWTDIQWYSTPVKKNKKRQS